ncbi:unnamed protein product [Macrosiphum euphorbiae]|uniref:Uncharacterized protein n=1 Tax=Macrosiphum euphorbiae TaxID=13131 RepID=A0AAV0WJJ3_9HEMI|nr:unnamed protein product [Macrosiphum euphorbiae]
MGDNIPLSVEIPLILRALDFFRELKNELLTERHKQFVYGDRVILLCFRLHVLEANNIMTMPLPLDVLDRATVKVTAFVHAVIDNPSADRSICVEVGLLLEQLIARRILSTDRLFEE